MLEGLVAWVLNNYLGKYVENLNTDQLSVALLSGKVELENLPLKKDALRHLGLPVEIKAGFIGKVQLQVPVRQIRSAPWLIAIEKLYLVAAPVNLDEWDANAEAHYAHERKVSLLDALEAQWRADTEAHADASYYAASYSSWLSYGTGLLANIVENLQLKVTDVHIRYEDASTCGSAFACGVTLGGLAAESCDSGWRRGFTLLAPDHCSYKLLELTQLALYWDRLSGPQGMLANCDIAELTERMSGGDSHRYIVSPVCARARLRRERTDLPLRSRSRPRLAAYLTLDTVLLDLTSRQYSEAVGCTLGLESLSRLREFRALRPAAPVHTHARQWWLYALACHFPHHPWTEPKPTWESCLEAARQSKQYVAICLSTLCNPAATLPPDKKAVKDEFEWRTPLHVLKPLREVAMRQVPKSTPVSTPDKPSSGRNMLVHWFPQWWGWYGTGDNASNPPIPPPEPATTTDTSSNSPGDLEEEILDVIADSLDNNTLLKRDTVFGKFEFVLNKGSLILSMEKEASVETDSSSPASPESDGKVELHFSAVSLCVESRPRGGSHALRVSLGALSLRDRVTKQTLFPIVCAPQGVIREGLSMAGGGAWRGTPSPQAPPTDEPLFQLTYEKKPPGLNCDYKLWVKSGSIEVVYCAELARWARSWACAPWGAAAAGAYHSVRDSTRAKLITHWEDIIRAGPGDRRSWQVELDISAPQILFAEEMSSREGGVLLIDFGRLRLGNIARAGAPSAPSQGVGDEEEMFMTPCSTPPASLLSPAEPPEQTTDPRALHQTDLHDRLYDRYNIELSELQILVGRARDSWQYAHTKTTSSLHLLDRFSISLQAERRVVHTVDPQYPSATLRGSLPALVVHLSEHKLRAVRAVLDAVSIFTTGREQAGTDAVDAADDEVSSSSETDRSELSAHQHSRLLMLQFAIDQLSLEVTLQMLQAGTDAVDAADDEVSSSSETDRSELSAHQHSRLLMLQFAIDQLSLEVTLQMLQAGTGAVDAPDDEVQSRGRSIAEVQVMGVRMALCWRWRDASLALSVHSLLLVDALQTYGPDFELLVASHKHVGMDTASGSIRGSEPTSPQSPQSPQSPPAATAALPQALSQALFSLHRSTSVAESADRASSPIPTWMSNNPGNTNPSQGTTAWGNTTWGNTTWGNTSFAGTVPTWGAAGLVDSEALIAVELCMVKGEGDSEDVRIANILFNNLDIIANQETIVELIGFTQRVFGPRNNKPAEAPKKEPADELKPAPLVDDEVEQVKKEVRTEITFDFHRLGVLLLRAAVEDGNVVARKIATATLCEAKIQATLDGSAISCGGSLGGVQVVSLSGCAGGHARVLSAGRQHAHAELLHDDKALHFEIHRNLLQDADGDSPGSVSVETSVCVRVARVWYTHQPTLLLELGSCLQEFKTYLANLARSLRAAAAAAADMALGLAHTRESLYMNPRLSQSTEGVSPRRRTFSLGASVDEPGDRHADNIVLSVSVELESPVVVIPRSARSTQVVVAHLGRMSLANRPGPPKNTTYKVRIRDISLASLDVGDKLEKHPLTAHSMQQMYDVSCGKPVLHNTALQFNIHLADADSCQCEISGAVVGGLQVSARREQYEQLLDTLNWISAAPAPTASSAPHASVPSETITSPVLEPAVPTLRLDPAVRAAVLAVPRPALLPTPSTPMTTPLLIVKFSLPIFSVELRADLGEGERSLVDLSFREFSLNYKKTNQFETTLQVSLHSITMEDLSKDPDSKHRLLMVSHAPQMPPKAVFVSKSCPDFLTQPPGEELPSLSDLHFARSHYTSLPGQLHVIAENKEKANKRQDSKCGPTPPCSPECGASSERNKDSSNSERDSHTDGAAEEGVQSEEDDDEDGETAADENLVWVWVHTRDPRHPRFHDTHDKVSKLTKVELNSLNLVVNIDSWVAVLDFFGIAGDDLPDPQPKKDLHSTETDKADSTIEEETGITVTEMCIRSLSAVVVSGRGEWCGARVARVRVSARRDAARHTHAVRARLGALALRDLTPHAPLWRDTLRTHAHHALTVQYNRLSASEATSAGHETRLSIEMGPVSYVHTKRFVHELQAFTRDFGLLRRVIMQARLKVSVGGGGPLVSSPRMRISLSCCRPEIIVPVSGRSRNALAVQVARLTLSNRFQRAGDAGTVSSLTDSTPSIRELLDVRTVQLESLTLHGARGGAGGGRTLRLGPPLLTAPAQLTLQIEHNTSPTHNVPDMTIQGTLTTLECALDPAQYRLVRGVLAHNLGEALDEPAPLPAMNQREVWTTSSIKLDLQDVTVHLEPEHGASSLACINFIKSRLVLETYSDMGQDIDLVSQEILVSDTRFANEPANRRGNVFSHIIQPMAEQRHSVQAEVHARKRQDTCAYTILINNMRLMAILEWWERAHHFLTQPPLPAADSATPSHTVSSLASASCVGAGEAEPRAWEPPQQVELKLNVTDSQLVLVEEPSVWDTNAVILRSTTVITYRGADAEKPVSCSLNELEVFSCVLGLEEETALSIVEPAALHVTIDAQRVLHVAMSTLDLRLSYHDMRMFASMLQSLPLQVRTALSGKSVSVSEEDAPANLSHMRSERAGTSVGAGAAPWVVAPRWMRARAPPSAPPPLVPPPQTSPVFPLKALQVNAECITLCVIDDCLDSDVPLLEVSLSDLQVEQDLRKVEEAFEDPMLVCTPMGVAGAARGAAGAGGGRLSGLLSIDYYNRTLSGWEPVVEPWRFDTSWEYTLSSSLSLGRVQLQVNSNDVLNTNVTSSLIELCQLVRANWAADYYAPQSGVTELSPKGSPAGHRRRSPFVPYALRNHTGHRLWFTTLITTSDVLREESTRFAGPDDSWVAVRAGDTEPFSFGARRGRARGRGRAPSHTLHQLALRLEPWAPPDPVCVDRVGVFFRHLTHAGTGAEAWLVFEVSLEGSARKLVTVRSALQLVNQLPHPVEVRVDHAPAAARYLSVSKACERSLWSACAGRQARAACAVLQRARAMRAVCALPPAPTLDLHPLFVNCAQWTGSGVRCALVAAGGRWSAPLAAHPGALWTRPLAGSTPPAAPAAIDWRANTTLLHYECRAPPDHIYRFCCVLIRERFPPDKGTPIAGHTLTLVPALRLENLLPLELQYRAAAGARSTTGATPAGDTTPFHQVNVEEGVELSVKLEGFGWSTPLVIGGAGGGQALAGSFGARLKLRDTLGRRLYLNARVTIKKTDAVKVCVYAAYWLVNRTGLALVFRAEGSAAEAAGQFAEHEVARAVAPLLFAFADTDAAPTIQVRLGRAGTITPQWCSPFGLGPGVGVKKLEARGEGGEERVVAVGVSVRAGRGRYRHTNIVTFTPRYQLHNNTRHHLQFAQKCTATTLKDPAARSTHVSAVAGCYLPWQWARWEREQLLCVRVLRAAAPLDPRTAWSAGFQVHAPRTLTLACREAGGSYQLVRVEVAAQGATLFVVLTDAESAPPPIAIHNYSPVSIMFHQVGCTEECVVGAHGRARWALPEVEGTGALALRAPGGPRTTLHLTALEHHHTLLYQNFIYVAFLHSRHSSRDSSVSGGGNMQGGPGGDDSILVLEVPLGSTRVVLANKRYGDRSQLWRRGPNGQLIHEGSSVPQPTDVLLSDDAPLSPHSMVLDIEDSAPRPGRASALVLRRADPRRASTQAWRLAGGRMLCAHRNLCVQPDGATFMSLAGGARVVLAMTHHNHTPPPEQAVAWHSLRPGSGRLSVSLTADGPTRLITIRDQTSPQAGWIEGGPDDDDDARESGRSREWGVRVSLAGMSVSLVARAELVHAHCAGLRLDLSQAPLSRAATLTITDMQWDNQLLGTPSPVLLYCLPGAAPALHAALELQRAPSRRYNAYFFKHLVVALRPLAIRLEERLILQVWELIGAESGAGREQPDEAEWETRRMLDELCALHATRYYFARIELIPSQIRLSMCTANKLEGSLSALKRRLGLTLIKFEDAAVELEPFVRAHVFDTAAFLARQMLAHFKDELKWQAAKILGSVDFLGNPLGFVADVSEGVSGLLLEGNVAALLQNVTHGISNSAAKVTESLGDGLERVVGDESHEETRRRIRSEAGGAHLAAGLRGLGLGILGGMTSLVKHSYEGAAAEGLGGFLTGVGKGLVGTVTKPVIGVLDLAAETATALRETSRRAGRAVPQRARPSRCVWGAGGLLPRYCPAHAQGVALLYALNGADYRERFLAYLIVRDTPHDIRALLSDCYLRIFTCKHHAPHVVMETHLSNLVSCTVVCSEGAYFVELGVRGGVSGAGAGVGGGGSAEGVRRPRVQCDSRELAAWVARHAAYARQLYHECVHTLHPHAD